MCTQGYNITPLPITISCLLPLLQNHHFCAPRNANSKAVMLPDLSNYTLQSTNMHNYYYQKMCVSPISVYEYACCRLAPVLR